MSAEREEDFIKTFFDLEIGRRAARERDRLRQKRPGDLAAEVHSTAESRAKSCGGSNRRMEKLKITITDGEVNVVGNREGLLSLADVCARLAALPETREESRKLGNHYHFSEFMNSAEPGSVEMVILYDPEL
jgi:hypothetical protein